ncbi:hypothetical protein SDC9_71603 [bioreactor metagenome]|uniref:DUF4020 domain-containing protein n=1 Tax=bioreactor metagenome TaxID=1076179 RepID=A0A644YF02_9ZZZZ
MADALAATRSFGENPPEMFAFCGYETTKRNNVVDNWKLKGVTPIPYDQKDGHRLLRETLNSWASVYSEGWQGKAAIVQAMLGTKPSPSTIEDDTVKKMIWALSDPSGKPAKIFAMSKIVPDLAWLHAFQNEKYAPQDLGLFGIKHTYSRKFEENYTFLKRPYSDLEYPPTISLVSKEINLKDNQKVMRWIGCWLARHLNNPKLIVWVSECGGILHTDFKDIILQQLNRISKPTEVEKLSEFDKIMKESSDGTPDEAMMTLWELALSGKMIVHSEGIPLLRSAEFIKTHGVNSSLKGLLVRALSPIVVLHDHTKYGYEQEDWSERRSIGEIVDAQVIIESHIFDLVREIETEPKWKACLADLLIDFTLLLKDAMDLQRVLGKITVDEDYTYIIIRSINDINDRALRNSWIILVELVRDAWIESHRQNTHLGNSIINVWWTYSYPIFKRLALFALAQKNRLEIGQVLQFLTEDSSKWLWSMETQYEVLQLLKRISTNCTHDETQQVAQLIISEPTNNDEIEGDDAQIRKEKDYAIMLRLGVMRQASLYGLDETAEARFKEIIARAGLPENVAPEDEFPFRESCVIDSGFIQKDLPPEFDDLYIAIRDNQDRKDWESDNWKALCKEHLDLIVEILLKLNTDGFDSIPWWNSAFSNWTDESSIIRSWEKLATDVISFSNVMFTACSYGLSRWLEAKAKTDVVEDSLFVSFIDRTILCASTDSRFGDDYVQAAINHPVGICTSALLVYYFNRKPSDNDLLPIGIKKQLSKLCIESEAKYINGKVILASNVVALFRVDPAWTREYLIPLFNWDSTKDTASGAWQGFLWNPRIYLPLFEEMKVYFLQTGEHRDKLKLGNSNYARLLGYSGIHKPDYFTYTEIANAISKLDIEELIQVADYVKEVIESAGEKLSEIWDQKILHFFHNCWPKEQSLVDQTLSQTFALICIKSGEIIERVFKELQFSISSLEYPAYVLMELEKTELCEKFPRTILSLIAKLFGPDSKRITDKLPLCLDRLVTSDPSLYLEYEFKRLSEKA